MLNLLLPRKESGTLSVLCLGAHSDDIEIGCGGTILSLQKSEPRPSFHWVVFSAAGIRGKEARNSAKLFLGQSNSNSAFKEYRDGFLPYCGAEVKDYFEELKATIDPDVIFTHWRGDAHQDHRLICELTWNTFRNHLILEYEIPKYDGDMGQPNVFVPLAAEYCERKITYLMSAFQSQRSKRWFEERTFQAILRLRGMECNAESGYAEAFYGSKIVL